MDASEVQSLLAARPDLEAALEAIHEVDRDHETWTFDDVPVDSGAFGELVGEGVVESVGDGYRLADPDTVAQVLDGTVEAPTDEASGFEWSLPDIDRVAAGALGVLLVFTAALRASTYPNVFRDRYVVYIGNDPYFYVYLVEAGLRNGWGLSEIPGRGANGEPLTIVQLLVSAELAGSLGSHEPVLAWLPVGVAVATVAVLYLFVCDLTGDRRVALASVLALSVIPIHVTRSALGFPDHHVFDYFWLVIAAWGLTHTLTVETLAVHRRTLKGVGLLAAGVAGGVLAWWAGALLLAPIGLAVVVGGALAVRDDQSFVAPGVATCLGIGIGAGVILLAHLVVGWHDRLIVAVPIALLAGSALVVAATNLWRRLTLPPWAFPTTGLGIVGVAAVGTSLFAPSEWATVERELRRLVGIGFEDTAEFQSIFSTTTMGWLFLFGLLLVFALPYLAWGAYAVYRGDRRWLAVSAYGWVMLGLATLLQRFGGELSPFVAVFAGLGIVHIAERVDAARPPNPFGGAVERLTIPEKRTIARLAFVVILVCGLSAAMAPISANNLAIGDEQYEVTVFIDDHAETHGYEYPESYVFSPWSWSRMYNHHVNGESRTYGPARSHYRPFSVATDPADAMDRVDRVPGEYKYLVTEPVEADLEAATMQSRLHDRFGSRGEGVSGLGQYRALYASDSGDYKVFRVVDGATIRGDAEAGATVTLETTVDIEGATFTYERQIDADGEGTYTVTVPYPGEYTIEGADATTVTVDEPAVTDGDTVAAE